MCAYPTSNFETCYPKHTYFLYGIICQSLVYIWSGAESQLHLDAHFLNQILFYASVMHKILYIPFVCFTEVLREYIKSENITEHH